MTRLMPRTTNMSPGSGAASTEKRRRPAGSSSPSRRALGSSSSSGASNSSPSSGSNSSTKSYSPTSFNARATAGAPVGTAIISPPPRAALSGTSSPVPDEPRNRNSASPAPAPAPTSNTTSGGKDGAQADAGSGGGPSSPGLTSALQRQLKERDIRIGSLERELGIMEVEFQRELNKRSAAESETATFWQAKHSALHTQFLRTDADVRVVTGERDDLRSSVESLRRELAARDDEARELRAQVRGLKEWVSNSTRSDGQAQTSDQVFGTGMARLGNELQNWVIVNFRKAKIDMSSTQGPILEELSRLIPMYEDLAMTSKIHLLQSIVSRILVELVFDAYFVGLSPEQGEQFTQVEALLGSFAGSPEPINQWRSLTLAILKKDAAEKMQAETTRTTTAIITRVNTILDGITDARATDARDQGLHSIATSAIEISRLLVMQKAVFKVFMPEILPHQRVTFDTATMEDIGGEEDDEDDLAEREICCVTFPGVIKRGDENGGHLQYRNVIVKARVLCSPE